MINPCYHSVFTGGKFHEYFIHILNIKKRFTSDWNGTGSEVRKILMHCFFSCKQNVVIKLADFGFAKIDRGDLVTPQFTPYYVSPQVLIGLFGSITELIWKCQGLISTIPQVIFLHPQVDWLMSRICLLSFINNYSRIFGRKRLALCVEPFPLRFHQMQANGMWNLTLAFASR